VIPYLLRRLAQAPFVLFVLATLTFLLVASARGDAVSEERALDPAVAAAQRAKLGLDLPLHQQYLRTMGALVTLDLPSDKVPGQTALDVVRQKLPVSLLLGGLALALSIGVGLALALLGAANPGTWLDRATGSAAMAAVAVPSFVIGPVLALVCGLWLGWLPVAGWSSWTHLLLPLATLSAAPAARIARLARAALAETANADHVRTARAKGASALAVLLRHQLPVALVPVIAFLGPAAAYLLTGSVVVEQVFQIPGLGSEFVQAALNRDRTLVMGLTVLYGALVISCTLASDLLVAVVDPRVRLR